ncbi:MAG: hypothetical protein P8N02_10615 [Actinomycetota bacterium]|jgi:hypothetical protein|nr:hypothetical protein [Actinomycetota bacterium]
MDLVRESGHTDGGVVHGALLARLCEAVAGKNGDDLSEVRAEVLAAMGPDQLVDAVGVTAMFHMMNRVANATGTPLDPVMRKVAASVSESIGASGFLSTADTPM